MKAIAYVVGGSVGADKNRWCWPKVGSILDVAYLESPEPTVLIGSEHGEVMSVALCLIVTVAPWWVASAL